MNTEYLENIALDKLKDIDKRYNHDSDVVTYDETEMVQMFIWGVAQGQRMKVDFTRIMSIDEQDTFLSELFGYNFIDVSDPGRPPHYVLYDENGDEFYGKKENKQFDFSTLPGIFSYIAYRAKQDGYLSAQSNMRKALGIS